MALLTADWMSLTKNVYYRKIEFFAMEWENKNLGDYIIAVAEFGGLIALFRDQRKFRKSTVQTKPTITIYSACGQAISSIVWDSGKLLHLGWTLSEDLLCITEEGRVLCYDMQGGTPIVNTMGQEAEDTKILDCKVFNGYKSGTTGVVVLTGAYHIFLVNNIKDARVLQMPNVPGLNAPPTSWAVVCDGRNAKVLVARDAQLYVLDYSSSECIAVGETFSEQIEAITEIAVSSRHQRVALFSNTGILWGGAANLKKKYFEFDTERKSRPLQLVWCADDAVVGFWPNANETYIMLIVGTKSKAHINVFFPTYAHLLAEIDGVRIISNNSHEFLQKVPDAVVDVFGIGSLSPSALLFEASKEFEQRNHKADEYMRMIREKNSLESAIENCVRAAGHEFKQHKQKMLLKAAYFGKCFLPDMNPELFVKMGKALRVLNQIRYNVVAIPLSFDQYEHLTLRVLLDRLVLRQHYPLAIKICNYMGIPETEGSSRILSHWAINKVRKTTLDPDSAAQVIATKLGHTAGISYAEISNKAYDNGQKLLSVKLLDYETRASEQVPLLIKLEQDDLAMMRAIQSGDTDLVFTVILYLENTRPKGKFYMKIREFPEAYSLYIKYYREEHFLQLRDTYYQESDFNSDGDWHVMKGYNTQWGEPRRKCLQAALESYKKARNEFATQVTEDQLKLLKYQQKLEEKQKITYVGLSLHETLVNILIKREYDWADELRKEFKVPDRRFWWLKIVELSKGGEWLELEKFSKSKKSPIGYEPFVDMCIKYGGAFEAKRYLSKVRDENKIKYCVKAGAYMEAAKFAYAQKDVKSLNYIQNLCPLDVILSEKISTMKSQLGAKH